MNHYEIPVTVSDHAYWRAAERFPGFDTARIEDEVREAFAAGRVSTKRPPGVWNRTHPGCLYLWNANGWRIYVVTVNRFTSGADFAVKTVLRFDPEWREKRQGS